MRTFLFTFALSVLVVIAYGDRDVSIEVVQNCLTEAQVDISDLGVSKVEDIDNLFENKYFDVETGKRNCFTTCVFRSKGLLTKEGKILDDISMFTKGEPSSYADAINACRAESDPCKLGWCFRQSLSKSSHKEDGNATISGN